MRFKILLWPTLAAVPALVVLVGFGNWQMDRLYWKQGLVELVAARTAREPVEIPARDTWPGLDPRPLEYTPVKVTGRFDHSREFHLFTSLSRPVAGRYKGPGYLVYTRFELDGGGSVLVNRGFVPDRLKDPATRPSGQVTGMREITGLIRSSETQALFVPDNDVAGNVWYYRDLGAMAALLGRNDVAPFILDQRARAIPGGLPQSGETRLVFKNTHLQYAVTWYGLALCLIGVYVAYHISANRALTKTGGGRER